MKFHVVSLDFVYRPISLSKIFIVYKWLAFPFTHGNDKLELLLCWAYMCSAEWGRGSA